MEDIELTAHVNNLDEDPKAILQKTCLSLLLKNEFVDCTLACSDGNVQAHKIVLASASSYLYNSFKSNPSPTTCSHPVILLRRFSQADVRTALQFIYTGRANTKKKKLQALIDISKEIGCHVLKKAIDSAIQLSGIEMFQKMVNGGKSYNININKNSNKKAAVAETTEKDPLELNNVVVIKKEKEDDYYINQVPVKNSNGHGPRPNLASSSSSSNFKNGNISITNGNGGNSNDELESNNNDNMLFFNGMDAEKGESFIYTNEDLGMISMEQDDGEDMNDEGETEESNECEGQSGIKIKDVTGSFTSFKNGLGMIKNEDDTNVPASCPWCMQVFTSLTLLQRHIKTHVVNYRPFSCDYCHNTFARSAHLKRHQRIHTGEKPFTCSVQFCNRAFSRQDKLKAHLVRHLQQSSNGTTINTTNGSVPIKNVPSSSSSQLYSVPVSVNNSITNHVPIRVILPTSIANNANANNRLIPTSSAIKITNIASNSTNNEVNKKIKIQTYSSHLQNNSSNSSNLVVGNLGNNTVKIITNPTKKIKMPYNFLIK